MCVRYTIHKTDAALEAISSALGKPLGPADGFAPRFNATLTHALPVVAGEARAPSLRPMRWGLVPAGDRASPRPRLLANARSETVASMPAFKAAVARRRCVVPANGYYEWRTEGGVRMPHLFTLREREGFASAGLWDPADAAYPETFCILTTRPNAEAAAVHDRMPVILLGEAVGRWIGGEPLEPAALAALTAPLPDGILLSRPVSRYVSNSRNEGPRCHEPPEAAQTEPEFDFG
jgi:putative SOS response-associated peptidase YedK